MNQTLMMSEFEAIAIGIIIGVRHTHLSIISWITPNEKDT